MPNALVLYEEKPTVDNNLSEYKFTELHLAAIQGTDVAEILTNNPELINQQDKLGMTAAHYAALYGHINILKQLVEFDLSILFIYSISEQLPIDLTEDKEINEYLRTNCALKKGSTLLHFYSYFGMQSELEDYLDQNPNKIHSTDHHGNTAIHYAILGQQIETFRWLIQHGVDPKKYFSDEDYQCDSVALAEEHYNNDDPSFPWTYFIKEIKHHCSLGMENLERIQVYLERLFIECSSIANNNGKKLLFIIGEYHCYYSIYEVQRIILNISKRFAINSLYAEKHPDHEYSKSSYWLEHYASNRLNMTVLQIDVAASTIEPDPPQVDVRNAAMTEEMIKHNCSAVLVTGGAHMKGLLEIPHSKTVRKDFYNKFLVVPISLSAIFEENHPELAEDLSPEMAFYTDSAKVIQIENKGSFTDTMPVIKMWNSTGNNPRLPKRPCSHLQRPSLALTEAPSTSNEGIFTCFTHWFGSWFNNPPLSYPSSTSETTPIIMTNKRTKRPRC